jgi:dihydroorotate dehydrogenase electron transfer subunit
MAIQEKCRILEHQKVAPQHFKLTISSDYIASHGSPGQFVNVRCGEGYDPLLRRPLSLHRILKEHKRFELLYEVVGKGTEILSQASVGSELDILGPLGNGFVIDKNKKIALLVGGGMGIAPLAALAEQISNDKSQMTNALYILIGAKNKRCLLCENELKQLSDQVLISTDDGSQGRKGLISDILVDVLENQLTTHNFQLSTIYACGPRPMLKAISEIAMQKKIDCQISMEERMGCGIGTCLGCVVKTRSGYKKVCDDGPVFNAKEIIFEP